MTSSTAPAPSLAQIAITLLNDVCARSGVAHKGLKALSIVFTDSGEVWTLLPRTSAFAVVPAEQQPAAQIVLAPQALLQILYGTFDPVATPLLLKGDGAVVDAFIKSLTAAKSPLSIRF